MAHRLTPVIYLPHGGGPLPLLGDPAHAGMVEFLRGCNSQLGRPQAILVISAHWEEPIATVQSASSPELYYDYYGFPEESYSIQYPAPGHPDLAHSILQRLESAGIPCTEDAQRGFDHGVFVPLKLIYPQADIPCLQLSLLESMDPAAHIDLGRALAPLRQEGVLILGSGSPFHNMNAWNDNDTRASLQKCKDFDDWLGQSCCDLDPEEGALRLQNWEQAPHARYAHPREEHLLPLHICLGAAAAARMPAQRAFNGDLMGYRMSAFIWPG